MSAGLPVEPTGRPDAGVAVASGGAAWEPPLIPLIEQHRSGLRLVRRCVDLAELLAVCRAGLASVAVVAADLPRIARDDLAAQSGMPSGTRAEEGDGAGCRSDGRSDGNGAGAGMLVLALASAS